MDVRTCKPIRELRRYKAVLAEPQGIAAFNSQLLVSYCSSLEIHIYDPATSRSKVLTSTSDTAWGLAAGNDRAWAVFGYGPDEDRHLFEYDTKGRQSGDPIRCPDGTGSYISHDGAHLYLSQWYNKRVFKFTGGREFEPLLSAKRGICGIAAVNGSVTLLTTTAETADEYFLEQYDLSDPTFEGVDVAVVPFHARSLAWNGSEFLTNHREAGEIVAFSLA